MIERFTVKSSCNVKDAIEKMTVDKIKAVVIIDEDNTVKGLFSNGDMRTYFLKGGSLSASILDAMNPNPHLYRSLNEIYIEKKRINRVIYPIVDDKKKLIDVIDEMDVVSDRIFKASSALKNVPLVIMAGGKGTRLYPYTKILPKPLIPIGEITITERIIDKFRLFGCKDVYMILNYKANMIKAYMNEIEKEYTIYFIDEDRFLGTGGGLKLLKNRINDTFVLSNCDTLLDADYECAYITHKSKKNIITFIGAMKDMIIPYGVLKTNDDGSIIAMEEKPDYSYLINTGVYFLEPEVLDYIKDDECIGLPDLAARLMKLRKRVGVFPIPEKNWMDMGQFTEMENMMRSLGVN